MPFISSCSMCLGSVFVYVYVCVYVCVCACMRAPTVRFTHRITLTRTLWNCSLLFRVETVCVCVCVCVCVRKWWPEGGKQLELGFILCTFLFSIMV